MRDEDVARLSPLGFDHINMLGRYAFILPDQSLAANSGRYATPGTPMTGAEMQFRFHCCRTPNPHIEVAPTATAWSGLPTRLPPPNLMVARRGTSRSCPGPCHNARFSCIIRCSDLGLTRGAAEGL